MPKELTQPTRRSGRLRNPAQGTSTALGDRRQRATPKPDSDVEDLNSSVTSSEVESAGVGEEPKEPPPQETRRDGSTDPSSMGVDPATVNQAKVDGPILALVHRNLRNAWSVNGMLPMCFTFDYISPARRFKRGMLYSDSDKVKLPILTEDELGNVTETDGPPPGLMPYAHDPYK